jgi:hypothetical protein
MNIKLTILESDGQIAQSIVSALKPQVETLVNKSIKTLQNDIQQDFESALKSEPEYESLKSGRLKYEFGLPQDVNIDEVVSIMSNSIKIQVTPSMNPTRINMGITISIFDKSGEPAISSDNAFMTDEKRGYSLPWLEWLLFKGTRPLVKNFTVKIGPNKFSRTGMALMIDSNKNWKVPSEFAGSPSNNWATRALDKIEDKIKDKIGKILRG